MAKISVFKLIDFMINATFPFTIRLQEFILKLKKAVKDIREAYTEKSRKTSAATDIDYSDILYQVAYEYLYLGSHINMIEKVMKNFWPSIKDNIKSWIKTVNKKKMLKVCCIGGGPGSDVFGLISFLKSASMLKTSVRVEATVLDKFKEWKITADFFNNVFKTANRFAPAEISYESFNFFELTSASCKCVSQADFVTLVKFISAVSADRNKCSEQLQKVLKHVKSESLVLFVENSGGDDDVLFKKEALEAGFTCLAMANKKDYSICKSEKKDLINVAKRFNMQDRPQQTASVSASIWKKT